MQPTRRIMFDWDVDWHVTQLNFKSRRYQIVGVV